MHLRERVRSGLIWTTLHAAASRLVNFAVVVVLARLLGPEEFGLIGMAMVFQAVLQTMAGMGLEGAVIHRRELAEPELSSLYWSGIASGVLFGAIFFASAPLVVLWFGEPAVAPIVRAASIIMVIDATAIVPAALLRKEMRLSEIARIDLLVVSVASACAIAAALNGFGVWSLVIQMGVNSVGHSLLLHVAIRYRPRLIYNAKALGWAYRFGLNVVGTGLASHAAHQIDRLLVGRLGTATLGLYTRAYALSDVISSGATSIASQVLFPALSAAADDGQVRRVAERALAGMAFILIPASVGVVCVARPLIVVLYGHDWLPAVPLLEALSVSLLLARLSTPVTTIFLVKGRSDLLFKWSLATASLFLVAVWIGSQHGDPRWVAIAHAAVSGLTFLPRLHLAGSLVGLTVMRCIAMMAGPAGCSVVMAAVVLALRETLLTDAPALVQLVAMSICGAVVYLGLGWQLRLEAMAHLRDLAVNWRR